MKRNFFAISFLVFCLLTYLGCLIVVHDVGQGLYGLSVVKPLVDITAEPAKVFYQVGHNWHTYGLLAVVIALAFVASVGVSKSERQFVVAVLLAVVAQFSLTNFKFWRLLGQIFGVSAPEVNGIPAPGAQLLGISVGGIAYLCAFFLVMRAFRGEKTLVTFDKGREEGKIFGAREFVLLCCIFLVGLVLRMYALNVLVDVFEGELAAFSAGGTSLKGMFVANQGAGGPWAPLGVLYYVPIYMTTKLFGTTLVALRLSSALVGVLTIPLVYLLASRLGGRCSGFIAAALFSLNCLHVGWGRTDVHPHGVTTWPTLLLCFALLKTYDTRRMLWASVAALIMGLSWHQYPSGQGAVMIPFFAIGFFWISNRFSLPFSKATCAVIVLGLLIWFVGSPISNYAADGSLRVLNPFTLTGPRALWSSPSGGGGKLEVLELVVKSTLGHVGDVLQGLFFRQKVMCHQEWLGATPGTFMRTVPWLEMSFVFIGMVLLWRYRARFETAVMFGWLLAGILPGVLSEQAYPKRLSTFYPALDIIASLALATLVYYRNPASAITRRVIVGGIVGGILVYTSLVTRFWLAGGQWKYQEPADVRAAARLSEAIRPDTIIIEHMSEGYDRAKYLFLLLDSLADPARRPNRWILANGEAAPRLIADPLLSRSLIERSWVYTWTKLRDQIGESVSHDGWKRVVFLLQTPAPYYKVNEALIEAASKRCASPRIDRIDAPKPIIMIECDLSDLR